MKRVGFLMDGAFGFLPLCRAARTASRGKKGKARVAAFLFDLEREALTLEREILSGLYRPLPYRTFMVYDPKERRICAADFRDRVVHHAACKVLEPLLERHYIHDTYACREDKGTHRAIRRAQYFSRRYRYFLKLDVHKFFDSVHHGILKGLLRRLVKDRNFLSVLDIFIDHPIPGGLPGKGLPIGNLTSQHFANYYLSGLDHFIKEGLRIRGYLRYMDDLLLFAGEKATLWDACARIEGYLETNLDLTVRGGSTLLAPVDQGIPFLGFRIFPGTVRIDRRGWRRFRRKVLQRHRDYAEGAIDDEALVRSMASLVGHLVHGNTRNLRANFFEAIAEEIAMVD